MKKCYFFTKLKLSDFSHPLVCCRCSNSIGLVERDIFFGLGFVIGSDLMVYEMMVDRIQVLCIVLSV